MLERMWSEGNTHPLLVRMQTCTATVKISENWDLLKLRSFCKAKDTVSKTKRLPSDWEIFTNPSSDKGLISKIYKELKKLDNETPINPIKNGVLI